MFSDAEQEVRTYRAAIVKYLHRSRWKSALANTEDGARGKKEVTRTAAKKAKGNMYMHREE